MATKTFSADNIGQAKAWRAPEMGADGDSNNLYTQGMQPPTAADIEAWQKQSREEGYKQGHSEGLKAAKAEMQPDLQFLKNLKKTLSNSLSEFDAEAENELLSLALQIAQRLVSMEVQYNKEAVLAIIREAQTQLPSAAREIWLELNPADAVLVKDVFTSDADPLVHLVEKPAMSRAGCVLRTSDSRLDATLETRLAVLTQKLLSASSEEG